MIEPVRPSALPWISVEQMVEVDRLMVEEAGITLLQTTENAGRCLAHLSRFRFFEGNPRGRRIVVLVGPGGNGGGALVAARRLAGWGARVTVAVTRDESAHVGVPAHQLGIVRRMGLELLRAGAVPGPGARDLVLDGLLGYSLAGAPRGAAADLVRWANGQDAPVLSLDAPSGVDADDGTVHDPAIRATATMTLALPKRGFRAEAARERVGELYLADIGVPPELWRGIGLEMGPLFAQADVLRIR